MLCSGVVRVNKAMNACRIRQEAFAPRVWQTDDAHVILPRFWFATSLA